MNNKSIKRIALWFRDNPEVSLYLRYFIALWGISLLPCLVLGQLGLVFTAWSARVLYEPGSVHFILGEFGTWPKDKIGVLQVILFNSVAYGIFSYVLASLHKSWRRPK